MTRPLPLLSLAALIGASPALAGAGASHHEPKFLRGPISEAVYDGVSDDLLTAGLGKTGLMGAAPAYANPLMPTAAELRRNAIYTNYRALVDFTAAGGMGVFFGPNIDVDGNDTLGQGKIAGREYIAWADGKGERNVTLMVQLPDHFDPARPCIVSATSSGSRGIYGAIGTAGDWGLKRGCAVAYTDKGTGNGLHDLMTGTVIARDGTLLNAAGAGGEAVFKADVSDAELAVFNAQTPNRVAYKHAHSQQNPEADWGANTLDAIRMAFHVLNQRYGEPDPRKPGKRKDRFKPSNTVVIASSVSNGGGAALAAAEQDRDGLIDGVAVTEPNVQPSHMGKLQIVQGANAAQTIGRPLADYFTFANLYQPCAALSAQAGLSLNPAFWPAAFTAAAQQRCAGLAARGMVQGATLAEQADDALARMLAYGWLPESNFLQQSHFRFATNAIAVTYTNAAGRFSVLDRLCGFSFANTAPTGAVAPQVAAAQAGIFASGNGVPPTTGVNVVYDDSVGGARLDFLAVSPSSGQADFALDGALCQRALVTGEDPATGDKLKGPMKKMAKRVEKGLKEVQLDGRLQGLPTLIVAGRSDALVPVNHAARAYYAKTQSRGRHGDNTRYIEVTNAQHFDTFIAFGALLGYDTRYVPLHVYFTRAMDSMWAHLTQGTPLPHSQVVRGVPRGGVSGAAPALNAANVPPIAAAPAAADLIRFDRDTLYVPD